MADKRISQLIERVDIANNDVLPIVASGATTTNKVTISTIQDWMQENLDVGVTSVGITIGSTGTDVNVTGSPITTSGNITINIPTASATNRGLLSSSDWNTFTNQRVPYTGATGNVNLGEYGISTGYVGLDTTPTGTPGTQGTIYWDDSRSTAALIMNGTTQHIGQDSFFYVKNSTGSTIPKGTGVGFAGTDGASGHLLIQPFLANGSQPSTYFMGVTAEAITNGSFGQVMQFGELSGVNTSGYSAGALLYASTSVAGAFQTTAPQAPNNIILVAAAVNSTNNGSIIVRPQIGSNINNDEGVKITSVADKDLLQYQSGTGLWENKTRENAGVVTTDTAQTITGEKTFSGSSLKIAANGAADAVVLRNVNGTTGSDAGATTMGFNSSDNLFISTQSRGGFILAFNNSVSNRTYTLQDASGTLAFTSQIPANPVGGTGTVNQIPKFSATSTIGNSNISDNGSDVVIASRTGISLSGQSILITPNLGGTTNRIETTGGLPLALVTSGSSITLAAGGTTPQITLASTGTVTLTGALNGTTATFLSGSSSTIGLIVGGAGGSGATRQGQIRFGDAGTVYKIQGGEDYSAINFMIGSSTPLSLSSTGAATFSGALNGTSASFSGGFEAGKTGGVVTSGDLLVDSTSLSANVYVGRLSSTSNDNTNFIVRNRIGTELFKVTGNTGAATFTGDITASSNAYFGTFNGNDKYHFEPFTNAAGGANNAYFVSGKTDNNERSGFVFQARNSNGEEYNAVIVEGHNSTSTTTALSISSTGAATFSSSVNVGGTSSNTDFRIYRTVDAGAYLSISAPGGSPLTSIIGISGTNVMSLNQSGNVGIGTTSPVGKFEIASAANTYLGAPAITFTDTAGTGNSNRWIIGNIATDFGSFNIASAPTPSSTTFTPRLTITSSGNVGIGTASPTAGLDIYNENVQIRLANSTTGTTSSDGTRMYLNGSDFYIVNREAANIQLFTNDTERMRITSGGYLKVSNNGSYQYPTQNFSTIDQSIADWILVNINKVASGTPLGIFVGFSAQSPNNTSSLFFLAQDSTTDRFAVRSNGGIANYQANDVNLSDERTKKDIEPLESYWDKFKAIEIVKFKYKDQTHDDFNIGVIAQQVEAVAPEFVDVDGWDTKPKLDEEGNEILSEEEPLKSIYTADLHHATIKVLQEAMAKIEKLETEIESLKSQING